MSTNYPAFDPTFIPEDTTAALDLLAHMPTIIGRDTDTDLAAGLQDLGGPFHTGECGNGPPGRTPMALRGPERRL